MVDNPDNKTIQLHFLSDFFLIHLITFSLFFFYSCFLTLMLNTPIEMEGLA